MVRVVNVPRHPAWDDVSQLEEGDVVKRGDKIMGAVYDKDDRIYVCNTDWGGQLYAQAFSLGPEGVSARISRRLLLCNPVIPERMINKARSVYTRTLEVTGGKI